MISRTPAFDRSASFFVGSCHGGRSLRFPCFLLPSIPLKAKSEVDRSFGSLRPQNARNTRNEGRVLPRNECHSTNQNSVRSVYSVVKILNHRMHGIHGMRRGFCRGMSVAAPIKNSVRSVYSVVKILNDREPGRRGMRRGLS